MHRHSDEHPTRNEDEYFARENAELIKKMRAKLDEERLQAERKQHYMKCPRCGADLVEKQIGQVKVDECPDCDGIWLDQGEIDVLRHIQSSSGPVGRIMSDILGLFKHPNPGDSSTPRR